LANNTWNIKGSPLYIEAKNLASKHLPHLTVAMADYQPEGKITEQRNPYDQEYRQSFNITDAFLLPAKVNERLKEVGMYLPSQQELQRSITAMPARIELMGIIITPEIQTEITTLQRIVNDPKNHDFISNAAIAAEVAAEVAAAQAQKAVRIADGVNKPNGLSLDCDVNLNDLECKNTPTTKGTCGRILI
jgi:hypothetical protein